MKMIIVTQCCCGCTVRTGTLIIGILCGLSVLLEFIFEVTALSHSSELQEGNRLLLIHEKEDHAFMSKGELIASAIISVIILGVCISLVYGTLKDRLNFILVWIIAYTLYSSLVVLYILQVTIMVIVHPEHVKQLWEVPVLLIALAVYLYFIIVVNSHYRNLKDGVTLPPRPPLVIAV